MQEERQLQMLGQRDRQTQFASREERDRWIHAEKVSVNGDTSSPERVWRDRLFLRRKLQQLVASEEHQLNELRRETEAAQVARTELEGKIEALETENQAATLSFVDANNDKKKLDSQFRRLEGQRRDLWSEENDILQRLRCAKDEANRASKALCRVVPHVSPATVYRLFENVFLSRSSQISFRLKTLVDVVQIIVFPTFRPYIWTRLYEQSAAARLKVRPTNERPSSSSSI